MNNNFDISVIIPVLNEEGSLVQLHSELSESLVQFENIEIIFIDDGSTDESYNKMKEIVNIDNRVEIIRFFKNLIPKKNP